MIKNGLYSVVWRARDGVKDGDNGVIVLRDGELPRHARDRYCDAGKLLAEQELTDQRWNN